MKNGLFEDSLSDASARVIAGCLPFMTMGMIGHSALLIASGSLGTVALFVFLWSVFLVQKRGPIHRPVVDTIMNQLIFPYVFALSFGIGIAYGERSGWYGVWFALFLAAWIIAGNCVSRKKIS